MHVYVPCYFLMFSCLSESNVYRCHVMLSCLSESILGVSILIFVFCKKCFPTSCVHCIFAHGCIYFHRNLAHVFVVFVHVSFLSIPNLLRPSWIFFSQFLLPCSNYAKVTWNKVFIKSINIHHVIWKFTKKSTYPICFHKV